MQVRCGWAVVVVLGVTYYAVPTLAQSVDLGQRYQVTLDFEEDSSGYDWSSTPQDIWRLKEFNYSMGSAFSIRLGPSQVVFGCHETNVLWAVVLPEKPGKIVAAKGGKGEQITSIWLRFHPARVGELFPTATVLGQGDPAARTIALQIEAGKIRGCWQAGGLPMVPTKPSLTFDMETQEGNRWFYSLDTKKEKIEVVERLDPLPQLPPAKSLDAQDGKSFQETFDKVWEAFDREYAMFAIKPSVDWDKLRETYRPRAAVAKDNHELATIIAEMLDHLQDLHIFVEVDGQHVPGYNRNRPLNANPKAVTSLIGELAHNGKEIHWGQTRDNIGYICVSKLVDPKLPQAFDDALEHMVDTKGLILDLRFNGGGSEPLGCAIAGRFLDRRRVYSMSQFRSGPKHSDLTPKHQRACAPAGPWHYAGPVIVLQGQKTMSSAESFALALAQCPQVTTLGDRTAGSSGNPRRIEAGHGIVVNLPRWIDLDPQGTPIDTVGIPPKVKIDAKPEDFRGESDPVLTAALENVRHRSEAEGPPPGGVLQRR